MNDRFLEIARLAVEDAAKYSQRPFDLDREENETFAYCLTELIVRECAKIAADQSAIKPEYRIIKHFGVE
jgi:hypothetical protein